MSIHVFELDRKRMCTWKERNNVWFNNCLLKRHMCAPVREAFYDPSVMIVQLTPYCKLHINRPWDIPLLWYIATNIYKKLAGICYSGTVISLGHFSPLLNHRLPSCLNGRTPFLTYILSILLLLFYNILQLIWVFFFFLNFAGIFNWGTVISLGHFFHHE